MEVSVPIVDDLTLPRDSMISMEFVLLPADQSFSWQWQKDFGDIIVRSKRSNQEIDYAALLSPGQRSADINITRATTRSLWQTLQHYVVVGFEHIIPKGLDHILFVLGLFLLSPFWRPILVQVTTFTVAHSITLALGVSGVVVLSPAIIEPLIALSIVFICLENLFAHTLRKWRVFLVFAFGLLHGLGFAFVLGEVGLDANQFLPALLAFNIGVELGQLSVIALAFITVGFWFRNKTWYRRFITLPASTIIAGIGLIWFVQRIGA